MDGVKEREGAGGPTGVAVHGAEREEPEIV